MDAKELVAAIRRDHEKYGSGICLSCSDADDFVKWPCLAVIAADRIEAALDHTEPKGHGCYECCEDIAGKLNGEEP